MLLLEMTGKSQISFLEDVIPAEMESVDPRTEEKIAEAKNIVNDREAAFSSLKAKMHQQLKIQHMQLSKAATEIVDLIQVYLKSKDAFITECKQRLQGQ